jgi:hypothetical protein
MHGRKNLTRKIQYSENVQNWWGRMMGPAFYFFRRLTTASAVMPSMMPVIMDSHGKPGTAGSTIGVETEIVVKLPVVVGVLTTVSVDTEMLADVTVDELVVAGACVEAEDEVLCCEAVDVELSIDVELSMLVL